MEQPLAASGSNMRAGKNRSRLRNIKTTSLCESFEQNDRGTAKLRGHHFALANPAPCVTMRKASKLHHLSAV
jgi:hypothetical protein